MANTSISLFIQSVIIVHEQTACCRSVKKYGREREEIIICVANDPRQSVRRTVCRYRLYSHLVSFKGALAPLIYSRPLD